MYVFHMAALVKGLTQWIVVPPCIGSNPICRPIKKKRCAKARLFILLFKIIKYPIIYYSNNKQLKTYLLLFKKLLIYDIIFLELRW